MESNTPTVSVVMGVYNGERYLREAVESVLGQTFGDFEFIIIDDGSSDRTAGVLREYSDPRMRTIANERNEGLTRCLIKGCELARGKYIARMDADDISYPERFAKQVEFLDEHPDYAVVGTRCRLLDNMGTTRGASDYCTTDEEIRQDIRRRSPFAHGATMFRREYINDCGGYREPFRYAQDYDLWLRTLEKYNGANLSDALYGLRYHRDSLTLQKLFLQSSFCELAREFARERAERGSDPLMRGETESVRRRIESWSKNGVLKNMRIRSDSAAQLLHLMAHVGTMPDIAILWFSAVINNPVNKDAWKFLFSSPFKTRMKRTLKSRLPMRGNA